MALNQPLSAQSLNTDPLPPEIVKSDFGQGGVVIGSQAVNQNMADALGTYEEVLANLNQKFSINSNNQIMSKDQTKEINADQILKERDQRKLYQ